MKKQKIAEEIQPLLPALDEAFDRAAWHGPNLRGSLRGLSAEQALWRPAPGRHNIWELTVHTAYWKFVVRRRLAGGKRNGFSLPGSNWFERSGPPDAKAWRKDLALLENEHRMLRETIAAIQPAELRGSSAKSRRLIRQILGIALHDVYHAGQIRLLRRLQD